MKPLTDEDTQSELLQTNTEKGDNINATKVGRDYSSIIDKDQIAKKKRLKWIIIGLIILIIVILAIVLPLTLKKSHDNPSPPIIYPHYNPYKTKDGTYLQSNISGVLEAPA